MKTMTEFFTGFYNTLKNKKFGKSYGLATLDDVGRIPFEQLPESAMTYEGNWDASTNTPTLTDGVGTKGMFYVVEVGGTWNGIDFIENDRVIYDGANWKRLPAGQVSSVNGKSGAVVLTGKDIAVSQDDENKISDVMYDKVKTSIGNEDKSYYLNFSELNNEIPTEDNVHTTGTLLYNPVSKTISVNGDNGIVTRISPNSIQVSSGYKQKTVTIRDSGITLYTGGADTGITIDRSLNDVRKTLLCYKPHNQNVSPDLYDYSYGPIDHPIIISGFITTNASRIQFTVRVDKSLEDIGRVELKQLRTTIRKTEGGYLPTTNYITNGYDWIYDDAAVGMSISCTKLTNYDIAIDIIAPDGKSFSVTNNTPLSIGINQIAFNFWAE